MQVSLRALRVNANLSRTQAANAVGVDASTISRWESGKSYPNLSQVKILCEIYHCEPNDIFVPIE